MIAPEGGLFSKLNLILSRELGANDTVNDNNFPSSIVNFPIGLILSISEVGVDVTSAGSLEPAALFAETLKVYFESVVRSVAVYEVES